MKTTITTDNEEWAAVNTDEKAIKTLEGMMGEYLPEDQGYRALAYAVNVLRAEYDTCPKCGRPISEEDGYYVNLQDDSPPTNCCDEACADAMLEAL